MVKTELTGMDELLKNLQQLGVRASSVEDSALKAGAEIIATNAKGRAPRSRRSKAHMADHIVLGTIKKASGIKKLFS